MAKSKIGARSNALSRAAIAGTKAAVDTHLAVRAELAKTRATRAASVAAGHAAVARTLTKAKGK
jgi:hypothetical protein